MPTFGSCENIPVSCTLGKSRGKIDVRSSGRSSNRIRFGRAVSTFVHKGFLDSLKLFLFGHLGDSTLRGWVLYNRRLYIVVILVVQKCNEMCFSFSAWIHLEEHSGSLECVTALFVYLNACDNIRGSILLHSGVLPLASHRSRIGPDVVQILKTYHVCFVFLWTQNMSKRLLFLQTESFLYCSLHGRNFCIIFNYIWPLLKVPRINAICKNIFPRASLWKCSRWKWSRVM